MPHSDVSIAIIGGGLGGLTAALSLLQAGFDVHVYERATVVHEVGAGIQVSPNASRVLYRLGLADELARMGVRPLAWHQRRWQDGRTLLRTPQAGAMETAFGFPHYQTHRADLLNALLRAIPEERVHPGHRLTRLTNHDDRVEAEFDNGARVTADLLVGADGIHSAVRDSLLGPQEPRFTGCACYRGLVPAERLRHLNLEVTSQVWMGPGKHFVHYYVRDCQLVNFVAVIEQPIWTGESWTDAGNVADALALYDGWHSQVLEIMSAVDEIFVWAVFERAPLERWSVGRVTLLGDACHAMVPFMAQGAAQAMEDGATLASCLAASGRRDIPAALQRYQAIRLPRTSRVQAASMENKTRFHLADGPAQEQRDRLMATGSTDWSTSAISWVYDHDASKLEASA
jgi:salicylate hydroxylase